MKRIYCAFLKIDGGNLKVQWRKEMTCLSSRFSLSLREKITWQGRNPGFCACTVLQTRMRVQTAAVYRPLSSLCQTHLRSFSGRKFMSMRHRTFGNSAIFRTTWRSSSIQSVINRFTQLRLTTMLPRCWLIIGREINWKIGSIFFAFNIHLTYDF